MAIQQMQMLFANLFYERKYHEAIVIRGIIGPLLEKLRVEIDLAKAKVP